MANLQNKAEVIGEEIIDHTDCEECMEDYLFLLKDNYHEFTIGLSTILTCVEMAEKQGLVPKLPNGWIAECGNRYKGA